MCDTIVRQDVENFRKLCNAPRELYLEAYNLIDAATFGLNYEMVCATTLDLLMQSANRDGELCFEEDIFMDKMKESTLGDLKNILEEIGYDHEDDMWIVSVLLLINDFLPQLHKNLHLILNNSGLFYSLSDINNNPDYGTIFIHEDAQERITHDGFLGYK